MKPAAVHPLRLAAFVASAVACVASCSDSREFDVAGSSAGTFAVTTNAYTFGQAPDWMPDGEHVVHHADPGGGNQIYVAKLDGSDARCLTCGQPGPNMVPDSRPQGDVILFHSWRGTALTVGAPGFGGLGADLYVVPVEGGDAIALTSDHDGYDNYHAYFSPDGNRIVWTRLNWNFVTDTGRGHWDVRVADYVDDESGPHLENVRVVHEAPGHYFETQHWSPDGCGFLFTESIETTLNLELFYLDLCKDDDDPTRLRRLTNHLAWDEQAIFTPDMKKVIFMSTRDHESLWNTWAGVFRSAGTPPDLDHVLLLPLFQAGFLQPIAPAATDLYELDFENPENVRRLTFDGDDGWIIPEFVWDPAGERLLWTESKYDDSVRAPLPFDVPRDLAELVELLQDPPLPEGASAVGLTPNFLLVRRTQIGRYLD